MYLKSCPYTKKFNPERYVFHVKCVKCKTAHDVVVLAQQLLDYMNGALIQDAFPDKTKEERELMLSGICGDCWIKIFPPEDER